MDYAGWITAVCGFLEYQVTSDSAATTTPTDNDAFNNQIPSAIDYTENRLQRDLDFLATTVTLTSGLTTANSRTVTLPSVDLPAASQIPQLLGSPVPANSTLATVINTPTVTIGWTAHGKSPGDFISILTVTKVGGLTLGGVYSVLTVPGANSLTIAALENATSTAQATYIGNGIYIVLQQLRLIIAGKRQQPLEPVSRSYLDYVWPDEDSITDTNGDPVLPQQIATNDQATVLVGPAPDAAYSFESVGTMRIPQLSASNYTNFLAQQFPDLYVACSMVFWWLWQQNDDMAVKAEANYQLLLKSAIVEETRKAFFDMSPSPSNPVGLTSQAGA